MMTPRRVLAALLLTVGLASTASAQVSRVGTSCTKNDGTGFTHDLSCNVDGAATMILIRLGWPGGTTINSITWDQGGTNQAPALIGTVSQDSDSRNVVMYRVCAPTTGTRTLRVVWSAVNDGATFAITGFSGVDCAGTPVDGFAATEPTGGSGQPSPASCTPSASAASGDLVVDAVSFSFTITITDDGGTSTEDFANFNDPLNGSNRLGGSSETGTGSVAATWTYTGTHEWAMVCAILKQGSGGSPPSGPPPQNRTGLLGVN